MVPLLVCDFGLTGADSYLDSRLSFCSRRNNGVVHVWQFCLVHLFPFDADSLALLKINFIIFLVIDALFPTASVQCC